MTTTTDIEQRVGDLAWRWIQDWADIPPDPGHAHHGIAVSRSGEIVTGHASRPEIQIFTPEGAFVRRFPVPVGETHGITLIEEDGAEYLWIADNEGRAEDGQRTVIKVDLQGRVLAELRAEHFGYAEGEAFVPTAVAHEAATGRIWVTDGYGSSRVHRFAPDLTRELTIDGSEGAAGRFTCPHWIHIDTRKDEPELYIADRGNDRIQIYGLDGAYRRVIDEGTVTPSGFAAFGDYLVVAELKARLFVLDRDDRILGYLGDGRHHCDQDGWPNRKDADGATVKPLDDIPAGEFNSPHGIAADPAGNIYVTEWLLGDRFIKLERVT